VTLSLGYNPREFLKVARPQTNAAVFYEGRDPADELFNPSIFRKGW
jgi:hypothetical protein